MSSAGADRAYGGIGAGDDPGQPMVHSIPARVVVILIVIHTLWGAHPVAVKFGLEVFPPMWTAFVRFCLGIICVVAFALVTKLPLWPKREEWPVLMVIGVLFTIQIGTMNFGYDHTTGALGSVLIATNPLFAALFTHFLVAGDRMSFVKAMGLGGAFLGTVAILGEYVHLEDLTMRNWGNWVVLAAAAMLGLRLALSGRALKEIDAVRVAAWQMLISLPLFAAGGLAFETIRWENMGWAPLAGIAYQGIIIAGLAFLVFFHLMKRYPPSVIVSFNFVSPIAGVGLSAWLLRDPITSGLLIGMGLVAAGLYLITADADGRHRAS